MGLRVALSSPGLASFDGRASRMAEAHPVGSIRKKPFLAPLSKEKNRDYFSLAGADRGRLYVIDAVLADTVLAAIDDPGEERDIV